MNKTAIKNYAIWARVSLIESAKQRAYQYEITKDNITDANADVVSGKPLTKEEKEQRRQLIDQINRKGFDQVMEEVAYTWFNRFIALRFMEVNGYLPTKIRVFTDSEGNFKPEILKEALTVELPVDKSRVMELLEKQDNEELYKMLLIAQCNELSNGLPDMFEVISNYTELLFPNNLLKEDSILGEMVNSIPEEDWTDAVQIIGWLYQYYNSELKDETFALLKKNVKISKERIPAATQLFTPDWIVRYMVENSLGRLWHEGHPNDAIKKEWKYYIDEAQQEPDVEEQLKAIREEYKSIKPEDIKVIDPCMGSGHILVYAFDVLMQIYTSTGWSERDAAESILENNLFGLDIDDRAGQLAYFAVMMKARKYSRRILTKDIRPRVYSIQESNNVKIESWWRLGPEEDIAKRLVQDLTDAKEYGSILNLSVTTAELQALRNRLDDIEEMSDQGNLLDVIQSDEITRQLYPLVELAEVMAQKYDVVVTNPPYMGSGNMSGKLSDYVKNYYPDSKSDLFAVFIEHGNCMVLDNRFNAMVTMQSWMFLSSFERMRKTTLLNNTITSLMHMENMVMGIAFGTAVSVFRKGRISYYKGTYNQIKLNDIVDDHPTVFPVPTNRFSQISTESFSRIDGTPIAYWISQNEFDILSGEKITNVCKPSIGMRTGNNDLFLRLWYEIDINKTSIPHLENHAEKKWIPYNKGGGYRRWYGMNEYVVNWENDGQEIKDATRAKYGENISWKISNENSYFIEGITWGAVTSGIVTFRYYPQGFIFSNSGQAVLMNDTYHDSIYEICAFLNSLLVIEWLDIFSPTMGCESGYVAKLPLNKGILNNQIVRGLTKENIDISRTDWDKYETSWDFKSHPLV